MPRRCCYRPKTPATLIFRLQRASDQAEKASIVKAYVVGRRRAHKPIYLDELDLSGLDFSHMDFSNKSYQETYTYSDEYGTHTGVRTVWSKVYARNTSFDNANLHKCTFANADTGGSTFNNADLTGATISPAQANNTEAVTGCCVVQ